MLNHFRVLVCAGTLVAAQAEAQEVMSFIDPSLASPSHAGMKAEDIATVRAFAGSMGVQTDTFGNFPRVQWRAPMKTPGGYADIARLDDKGLQFLFRVPIPRETTIIQAMTLMASENYPRVAYLEVVGTFDEDGTPDIRHALLVLPVFKVPGSAFEHFADIQVFIGGKRQRVWPHYGPPGTPIRLSFNAYDFEDALESIGKDGRFLAEIGRFATSSALPPKVKLSADFKSLSEDLKRLAAQYVVMKGREARDEAKVYDHECMDGRCG